MKKNILLFIILMISLNTEKIYAGELILNISPEVPSPFAVLTSANELDEFSTVPEADKADFIANKANLTKNLLETSEEIFISELNSSIEEIIIKNDESISSIIAKISGLDSFSSLSESHKKDYVAKRAVLIKNSLEKLKKILIDKLDLNIKSVSIKEIITKNDESIARSKECIDCCKGIIYSTVITSCLGLVVVLPIYMYINHLF